MNRKVLMQLVNYLSTTDYLNFDAASVAFEGFSATETATEKRKKLETFSHEIRGAKIIGVKGFTNGTIELLLYRRGNLGVLNTFIDDVTGDVTSEFTRLDPSHYGVDEGRIVLDFALLENLREECKWEKQT